MMKECKVNVPSFGRTNQFRRTELLCRLPTIRDKLASIPAMSANRFRA